MTAIFHGLRKVGCFEAGAAATAIRGPCDVDRSPGHAAGCRSPIASGLTVPGEATWRIVDSSRVKLTGLVRCVTNPARVRCTSSSMPNPVKAIPGTARRSRS